MKNIRRLRDNIKYDLPASLVVFLVALPLCLGIALASGAPLFSGIIAGIVGGIVVSFISGSSLGVSGPAAGLAVIVLSSIQELGSFETFLLAVVFAGVIQIVLGILKAGVIGYYFPSAVIKGMLSGIGIIIILKQIPHAFGYDKDPEGDLSFIQKDGQNTLSELGNMLDYVTPVVMIITAVSLVILLVWELPIVKKSFLKVIPAPLVVVAAGIGINVMMGTGSRLAMEAEHLVNIPVAESLAGFFSQFSFPDFSQIGNPDIYVIAFTLAIVASLETLLCVEATDKLDPNKRVTPTNRELVAQGVGNVCSGLVGGLPVTQVIVRSSANIQSGARTKNSAIFHGLLLLGCAMIIPFILNLIPLASLATILIMVGYKLAKPSTFKEMFRKGREQFIPFIITIVGIIFTDLLTGIILGMIVAFFQILWNNFKTPFHFNPDAYVKGEPIRIQLSQDVTFLNKAGILHTLNLLPNGSHVIIDVSLAQRIHPDVLEIIADFKENSKTRDIVVEVVGWPEEREFKNPVKKLGDLIKGNKNVA